MSPWTGSAPRYPRPLSISPPFPVPKFGRELGGGGALFLGKNPFPGSRGAAPPPAGSPGVQATGACPPTPGGGFPKLCPTLPPAGPARSLPGWASPAAAVPCGIFFFLPPLPPPLTLLPTAASFSPRTKQKPRAEAAKQTEHDKPPPLLPSTQCELLGRGGEISSGRCPSLRTPCSERISAPGAWHQSCPRTFPHPYAGTGHGLSGSQRPPGAGGAPRSIPPSTSSLLSPLWETVFKTAAETQLIVTD